ncbi:MAG: VanZ family protein [Coprococcus sp.]
MKNTGKNKRKNVSSKKRFLYLIPVIIWMLFIFYMSAKDGQDSSAMSGTITERIVDLIEKLRNDTPEVRMRLLKFLETLIRKMAHMAEYGILFGFILLAVRKISLKSEKVYDYLLSIVICFLYACTDEVHQLFISGRNGNMWDVLIDMCGVFICLLGGCAIKNNKWRIITIFITAVLLVGLFLFLLFFRF